MKFPIKLLNIKTIVKRTGYYLKIWVLMSRNALLVVLSQRFMFIIFLLAKIIRYSFFISFLYFVVKGTNTIAGYDLNQVILIYLTFTFIDIASQFLFREVYRFRPLIISGDFDLVLVKPVSALFRVLMGGADIIDFVLIPPIIFAIWFIGAKMDPSFIQVILYVLLLANGLLIATGFYILVLSFGILTFEVDHTAMIFRDMASLGRLPIEVYRQPLRSFLTFLIPLGVMITLPSRVLMGIISPLSVVGSCALGIVFLYFSTKIWSFALTKYTSASS